MSQKPLFAPTQVTVAAWAGRYAHAEAKMAAAPSAWLRRTCRVICPSAASVRFAPASRTLSLTASTVYHLGGENPHEWGEGLCRPDSSARGATARTSPGDRAPAAPR